jgi:hypothetical protein
MGKRDTEKERRAGVAARCFAKFALRQQIHFDHRT